MTEVNKPIQVMLPEIRSKLLQHGLDGQAQHARTGGIRRVCCSKLALNEARWV
eukprot:CAMPEP_0185901828 /NCGR_PEP_ID=MMETSP0196C-20130402/1144_1 /TAXON_ID=2932 /ORGANISM="Alexandrium fundyense, Strain CCMP1719" /LENGTH=52 /DNA_ID=CAMNT_0028620553 /DNA_START=317 /DNA_END=475 /DNA_ORIENTATION=-